MAAVILDGFCDRVRTTNPFLVNRIDRPSSDDFVDVFGIHEPEFRRILTLARQAHSERQGIGVVVTGEAGVGKSHLLARLGRWARERQQAQLVCLNALTAKPERLPRALLQAILGALTHGSLSTSHQTPLFALMNAALREAAAQHGHARGNWEQVRHAYHQLIEEIAARTSAGSPLFQRHVYEVLFRYYQCAYPSQQGRGDRVATLALRWLAGELLSSGEQEQLGLPPTTASAEDSLLSEKGHALQVLIALTELAHRAGRLFLLCLDQADNLDEGQIQALSRFLQDLLGCTGNLLVVSAGVREVLQRFVQQRAIATAAWDRLAQVEVNLGRISAARGRELLWLRLQRFLAPGRGERELETLIARDALFPLGTRWLTEKLAEVNDMRPRDLLVWAARRWQQHQETLTTTPGHIWLNRMSEENASATTAAEQKPTVVERKSDTQVDPPTEVRPAPAPDVTRARPSEASRPGRA